MSSPGKYLRGLDDSELKKLLISRKLKGIFICKIEIMNKILEIIRTIVAMTALWIGASAVQEAGEFVKQNKKGTTVVEADEQEIKVLNEASVN